MVPGMTARRLAVAALAALSVLASACAGAGGASPQGSASPSGSALPSVAGCAVEAPPAQASIPSWDASSQRPTVFPVIVTSTGAIACGRNRIIFSFLDKANTPIAAPDRPASVAFYDLAGDPETALVSAEGTFIWAIEGSVGIYVVNVDLPSAGLWGAEFTTTAAGGPEERIRLQFVVLPEARVVSVGDAAPASDTPTLADVNGDVTMLSTDEAPVKAFYETSVADALAAKEPFLLVFATPKFCASAQCGPTLDRIKPIAAAHPDVTVINVEPYELEDVEGQLQPVLTDGALTPTAATLEWRLQSEPWVFVVDGNGIVTASFEGIVSEAELEAALAALATRY